MKLTISFILGIILVLGFATFVVSSTDYVPDIMNRETPAEILTGGQLAAIMADDLGEPEWVFELVELDELNAEITVIDSTHFAIFPYSANNTRTDNGAYKWKIRVNYTIDETDYEEEGYNVTFVNYEEEVKGNLNKNQLNKTHYFEIPGGLTEFTLIFGENSTIVEGSTPSLAIAPTSLENICITSDGRLHAAWEDVNNDVVYGNSTDDGATWTKKTILASTISRIGIVCAPNDDLIVYYLDTNSDLAEMTSTDGGVSFASATVVINSHSAVHWGVCTSNSASQVECCTIDSADDLWAGIVGTGTGSEISSADSDHCDVEFNSTDALSLIVTDSSGDDLDYMYKVDGGSWSSRGTVHNSRGIVDYNDENDISLAIDKDSVWHIAAIHGDDLQYCLGKPGTWGFGCRELDASSSFSPSVAVTEDGAVNILYSTAGTGAGNLLKANSSDGINWVARQTLQTVGGWPSLMHQHHPAWNNITTPAPYLFNNGSGMYFDTFATNYTPNLNCTELKFPTATGETYNDWYEPTRLFAADNSVAETSTNDQQDYYNFDFSIPTNAEIKGVKVYIEASGAFGPADLDVDLSSDGGDAYGTAKNQVFPELTRTGFFGYGSDTDLWGRTWNYTDFSDNDFRLRIKDVPDYDMNVDFVVAKVCFVQPIVASDTCTPPTDSTDWKVECSDNCVVDTDTQLGGDLFLSGSGTFTINAELFFNNTGQKAVVNSGCRVVINSGGKLI